MVIVTGVADARWVGRAFLSGGRGRAGVDQILSPVSDMEALTSVPGKEQGAQGK